MENTDGSGQQTQDSRYVLSAFAHEIRNPLALVMSSLQMIAQTYPAAASCEEWADVMENLEYIRELLNELTQYGNAEHIILKETDISALLRNAAASVRTSLNYLGIVLDTDIPDDLPALPVDRTKIRQALLNLLRNAQESIRHSRGRIRLRASALPHGVCISVSDNGCGMTPSQLENIFRPFVSYKPEGTGLGLSVTLRIIEAHGGTLTVRSTPGEGTEFQILLRG